jgi:predicted heme/steroid binding protein
MKKIVILAIFISLSGLLSAEEPGYNASGESTMPAENMQSAPAAQSSDDWKKRTFTVAELQKYDGTDGKPAYVAVEGIVYDVTNIGVWAGGQHMGQHYAGTDLTYEFNNEAPAAIHKGGRVLDRAPKMGVLTTNPNAVPGAAAPVPVAPAASAASAKKPQFEDVKISTSMYGKPLVCPVTPQH